MAHRQIPPGPQSWEHWHWVGQRLGDVLEELEKAMHGTGTPWRTTAELATVTGYTRPVTRLALAVLKRRGLVASRRLSPWPWSRQWRLVLVPEVPS